MASKVKDVRKPIEKFKGFVVAVNIRRHHYLMFKPRMHMRDGDWYASICPPGFVWTELKTEWKEQPTEDQLLAAVKQVAPTVRKIYIRNNNL